MDGPGLVIAVGRRTREESTDFVRAALAAIVGGDEPAAEPDGSVERALRDAGLVDVVTERIDRPLAFGDALALLTWVAGRDASVARMLEGLTTEQRSTLELVLAGMLRERSRGDVAILDGEVTVCLARL